MTDNDPEVREALASTYRIARELAEMADTLREPIEVFHRAALALPEGPDRNRIHIFWARMAELQINLMGFRDLLEIDDWRR